MTETETKNVENEESFLKTVRERYRLCIDADRENRERAKMALSFRDLNQWDEKTRNERENDIEGARPCLVVDKLNQHVMQVVNDQRQNRVQIKVRPVDDKGDPEVAKIYDGILRHIQDRSRADVAYDTAFECAVDGGFGFWRILTEYCDPLSFEQDIRIKRLRNRFAVYLDPERQEPDGSDARYGFILYKVRKEDFKKEFGKKGEEALESFEHEGKEFVEWYGDDWIVYAEYFWKEEKKQKILLLSDGSVVLKEEYSETSDLTVQKERETHTVTVRWRKLTGTAILEDGVWVGDSIPVVEVVGNELDIEGKVNRTGMIRSAMDAQRVDNYATSAFVENVALAPRSSYLAAAGQIKGFENLWKTANRRNISVLPYHPVSVDGVLVAAPKREAPPGVSQGWLSVLEQSEHNIQAAMGRYNATLGAPSNETSGRAIQARNREGDTGSYHFSDNLTRSLRYTGQMIVDIIPKIYDTRRIARIIGEDGEFGSAIVDPELADDAGNLIPYAERTKPDGGIEKVYNLGVGKYDVTIVAGPSYTTRRLESADAMMEISRGNKEFMAQFGDIIFQSQDWPGADKIAERFKKMLPPELKDGEPDNLEKQKSQIQQAAQALGQKEAQINNAIEQIQLHGQELSKKQAEVTEQQRALEMEAQRIEYEKKYMILREQFFKQVMQSREKAHNAEHEAALNEVVSKVEQMFAEHESQMKENILHGVTETFGEMHKGLADKMQGISDHLGMFEVQADANLN